MKIKVIENTVYEETYVEIHCQKVTNEIGRLQKMLQTFQMKLQGHKEKGTYHVEVSDVLYIETVDKKVFLYTLHDIYESNLKLYELHAILAQYDFIRIGKSMIINFGQVKAIKPDLGGRLYLVMNNGERCCVSRQYASDIKEKIGAK